MNEYTVLLAGNPNVGKSTIFNTLTGMHQHTGNWSGKTVENAVGRLDLDGERYCLIDLPGTYSLTPSSEEERVAAESICFYPADAVIVVGDATAPARSVAMARQIAQVRGSVLLCLNFADEAHRRRICTDIEGLSRAIGIPIVLVTARKKEGYADLLGKLQSLCQNPTAPVPVSYGDADPLLEKLEELVSPYCSSVCSPRHVGCCLWEDDLYTVSALQNELGLPADLLLQVDEILAERKSFSREESLTDLLYRESAELIARYQRGGGDIPTTTRLLDRLLLGRAGIPILLLLMAGLLWISLVVAKYPGQWLSAFFAAIESTLRPQTSFLPEFAEGLLWDGGWRVLTWVVAVMLPPMAIFFPLFTLMEDFGLLPRIAFVLDSPFAAAGTSGKQSLPMCMSLGCNCTGIVGTRIIDDPLERKVAIATLNFIPCNGRFPTLLCLIALFGKGSGLSGWAQLLWLILLLCFSVGMTLLSTALLRRTVYRGIPSPPILELPLYRPPQVGKVLLRSLLDRTLRVLLRAMAAAVPAGCILWLLANIRIGDLSLLGEIVRWLEPLGVAIGLDGAILTAFLLGLPANEIVLPILLMCYGGSTELSMLVAEGETLKNILTAAGWTGVTALCMGILCICHFPCSTALFTIRKETGDKGLTLFAALFPTMIGVLLCAAVCVVSKNFV